MHTTSKTAQGHGAFTFGIQTQVVSVSGFAFLSDRHAREQMARQVNDYIRDGLINVSSTSPLYRRFGDFAARPLGNPDDAGEVAEACACSRFWAQAAASSTMRPASSGSPVRLKVSSHTR